MKQYLKNYSNYLYFILCLGIIFAVNGKLISRFTIMYTIAFLAAIGFVLYKAKSDKYPIRFILEGALALLLGGFVGSHFLCVYILQEHHGFQTFFSFSGKSAIGGILGAIGWGLLYSRVKMGMSWREIMQGSDYAAMAYLLGGIFVKIGCFFSGCCFGMPCSPGWGVVFPPHSKPGMLFPNISLIPTQLYASLMYLIMFIFLLWLARRKPYHGYLTIWFYVLVAIHRLVDDSFRYFPPQEIFGTLAGMRMTLYQWIAIGLLAIAAIMFRLGKLYNQRLGCQCKEEMVL